jgi:iron complex outermembrane receptor protein
MKKKMYYFGFAAFMFFSAVAMAEETDEDKVKTMDEVVVTATRTEKDVKKVPANVTVITAEEIADSGASSLIEVLASQANIHVRTYSGNSSQAQIDLRGFGENGFGRTLVLLDGRRLNRLDMSSINWTQISLEQIERIEVVRGSGSVLYGDAAVAGVIHIMTKKGAKEPVYAGSVQIGEDSFYDLSVSAVGSTDRLFYSLYGANQKTDGWRDRTAFESYGGGFQIGYDFSDNLSMSGGATFNKTDFEMPGTLTSAELAQDRKQPQPGHTDDRQDNDYRKLNFILDGSLGNWGDIEVNIVYGNDQINFTKPSWWSFNDSDSDLFGVQPKYVLESNHGSFSNQFVTGVDVYRQKLTVDRYGEEARLNKTQNTEMEMNSVGWYVRDEISIGSNYILSGGFRIENAELQGRSVMADSTVVFDEEKDHSGEPYELSATWIPKSGMKFYAKYSTLYRYPFVDEQASYYGYGSDTFLIDLEAEEGKSLDFGFEIDFLENASLGLTLYQIDMEDEISWNGSTFRNENLDDTRHRGVEMFLQYGLEGVLDLMLNYTYQEATFEAGPQNGNEVPLVPNNLLAASIDFQLPYNISFIPSVQYVGDSYLSGDYDNNTDKLEDYTVVDLLLRYKRNVGKVEMSAFLKIANLFDEEYSTHGTDNEWYGGENTYYPSPGRKFFGGLSLRF